MADKTTGDTSESLTPSSAASLFEDLFSDETEETQDGESQEENGDNESEHVGDESEEVETEAEAEDPDDVEEEDGESETEPQTLKVKLPDGEQELPVEEVIKGYLRTADYTRKTQALADERKAFVGEQESVRGERTTLATQLTQLTEALKNMTPAEPDWDTLRVESPAEFPTLWADWQRHSARLAKVEEARKKAVEAVTSDQIAHMKQYVASEETKLLEVIPAWKDAAVSKKERAELHAFAITSGYTTDELSQVYDHRVMSLLRKAMLYDKGVAKKPAVQAKIDKVKVATPGPKNQVGRTPASKRARAEQRFAKTGSVRDAAAVFEDYI